MNWVGNNNIETIIHCGDLSTPSVLQNEFGPKFKGQFHFVHGNVADRDVDEEMADEFENLICHGDIGKLVIEGQKLAFCHHPDLARDLAKTGEYDLIFCGHTHRPWMETLDNGTQIINPGTLAGLFNKATFAVYDTKTKNLELKILETL